jgi:GT2 family glycosyltransferase
MSKHWTISVCIVSHNRATQTRAAIDSVFASRYPVNEIVVLDNASDPPLVLQYEVREPKVRLSRSEVNLGCPGGRNVAMLQCQGDLILHLDDDATLHPDALSLAIDTMLDHDDCAVVQLNIVEFGVERWPYFRTGRQLSTFSGGAVLMRASAAREVGPYEASFLRQGEEYDFSIRLLEAGYSIRYCAEALLHHWPQPGRRTSPEIIALGALAKCTTDARLGPLPTILATVTRTLLGTFFILARQGALTTIVHLWRQWIMLFPTHWKRRRVARRGYRRMLTLRSSERGASLSEAKHRTP